MLSNPIAPLDASMTAPSPALALVEDRFGPRIVAVGGGKGGVGKTVITANLAVALAEGGHRVTVVDADLGGANLHTVLGIPHPSRTLADFLDRRADTLEAVTTATPMPNLRLLSAARPQLGMANLKHTSKLKLLRHVKEIDADCVLLDLGAGTAFDTLDFFLAAHQGLLVVAPTPTSVENTYQFIRAAWSRQLAAAAKHRVVAAAIRAAQRDKTSAPQSPRELLARVKAAGDEEACLLDTAFGGLRWNLAVNQVRKMRDRGLGPGMARICRDYFGIEVRYVGCLDQDESVWDSVDLKRPTLTAFPGSAFSQEVRTIAASLMNEGGDHV